MSNVRDKIQSSLDAYGIAILPPMDVFDSIELVAAAGFKANCMMLDPWYNKGIGGELPLDEYDDFINRLLRDSAPISQHIYLWGFPEIIGAYVRSAPAGFKLATWLTWYYKNCPSVIRGWRSSQNACLHFTGNNAKQHPEYFLNDVQMEKFKAGKMRFIPGPSSVIENPLIIGFVGKKEQTGHPSQKPEAVYERLIYMATAEGELTFDPMAGSGTSGAVTSKSGRLAILSDASEEYTCIMEKRLGVERVNV